MKKENGWKAWIFYGSLGGLILLCLGRQNSYLPGGDDGMALALLIFAVVNWALESVPIGVTALLVILCAPLTGLVAFEEAIAASFGNTIFAFFLGVLLLSSAFSQTDLGAWISMKIFGLFGTKPTSLLLGILMTGCLLAMWVTEVAAAAIVFPIVMSLLEGQKERADYPLLGKAMTLAVAWGCAIGGVATPIATGANLIAVSYLKEHCGITIDFFSWMSIGLPISLTLLGAGWGILSWGIRGCHPLSWEKKKISLGKKERGLLVIFGTAIVLWIFGEKLGLESHYVALLAGVALFLPQIQILSWKKAISSISWDSVVLICAGVLLGDILYRYGTAETIARLFFSKDLLTKGLFLSGAYIVAAVSLLKMLFSSNTVSGIILVPIMISLAEQTGQAPWALVAPCIFSSALAFLLITSSPVNVIPYSARLFTQKDMLKYGSIMTVASAVIIAFWLMVFQVG